MLLQFLLKRKFNLKIFLRKYYIIEIKIIFDNTLL